MRIFVYVFISILAHVVLCTKVNLNVAAMAEVKEDAAAEAAMTEPAMTEVKEDTAAEKPFGFIGCFRDDKERDFHWGPSSYGKTGFSPGSCRSYCMTNEFLYWALQGSLCFCGNHYKTAPRYKQLLDIDCGKGPLKRGGPWKNAVYKCNSKPKASPSYIGCYMDDSQRDLNQGPRKYGFNARTCQLKCFKFKFFALQNNGWCVCGNKFARKKKYKKVRNIECGPGPHRAGKGWRNAVYSVDPNYKLGPNRKTKRPTAGGTKYPTTIDRGYYRNNWFYFENGTRFTKSPTANGGGLYKNNWYYFKNGTKYVPPPTPAGVYYFNGYYYLRDGTPMYGPNTYNSGNGYYQNNYYYTENGTKYVPKKE